MPTETNSVVQVMKPLHPKVPRPEVNRCKTPGCTVPVGSRSFSTSHSMQAPDTEGQVSGPMACSACVSPLREWVKSGNWNKVTGKVLKQKLLERSAKNKSVKGKCLEVGSICICVSGCHYPTVSFFLSIKRRNWSLNSEKSNVFKISGTFPTCFINRLIKTPIGVVLSAVGCDCPSISYTWILKVRVTWLCPLSVSVSVPCGWAFQEKWHAEAQKKNNATQQLTYLQIKTLTFLILAHRNMFWNLQYSLWYASK